MPEIQPRAPQPGLSEALEFAALSGPFEPLAALRVARAGSREEAAEVASALAAMCDTNPDDSDSWLLLGSHRQAILGQLREAGDLAGAIDRRRSAGPDAVTSDLLDAIAGTGHFTPLAVQKALSSNSREQLVRVATVLDWAGSYALAAPLLEPSRTAIKRIDREDRRRDILAQPFVGRDKEVNELLALLARPQQKTVRGVFLSGPPGIGKSALLEQVIIRQVEQREAVVVRLDFDRAGLDVTDLRTLTMEAARQVSDRVGEGVRQLLEERLRTASLVEGTEGVAEIRRVFPEKLASEIARTLRQARRPLLVVVDTLESLQARGSTHLDQLFAWLQRLFSSGIEDMSVLVAGRAAPPDEFRAIVGKPVVLEGLSPPAGLQFAERLEVAAAHRPVVVDRAAGVPLAIKLAADIVRDNGIGALPEGRLNPAFAAAMLYRILLSRIDDDALRDLAHPGLIVRRISAQLLREVIGPAVGQPLMSEERARELFEALARQHWLVETDPDDPDFVRHRGDIRRDLLPLLYDSKPAQCARIDRAAAQWFAARDDRASALDTLYHRLQLLRRSPTRPAIPEALASQFDEATLAELPESAQILVKQIVGAFSSAVHSVVGGPEGLDDVQLVRELLNILAKADWGEGRALADRIERTGAIDPRSRLADAVRAFWWRAGQWYDANWLLRERDRLGEDDSDLVELEAPLAAARIEMRGEYGRAGQVLDIADEPAVVGALRSAPGNVGRFGGLAFRLRRVNPDIFQSFEIEELPDPAAAAMDRWSDRGSGRWHGGVVDYCQRRLQSVGVSLRSTPPPWVESQMAAALTPYAGLAVNLAQGNPHITLFAQGVLAKVLSELHSPLLLADELSVASSKSFEIEPITSIANTGLFAEWAEAAGYVLEIANLRSIGRAADNWRRTMAGDWRYGRGRPRDWAPRPVDEVLAARIERLLKSPRPYELALVQLGVWIPDRDGEGVWELIQSRSAGALVSAGRALREGGGPWAAAAKLRQYKVPTAFVPSIITLLQTR